MCFLLFLTLFVIFLNFVRWNLPTFSPSGIRILNTKKVGFVKAVFSISFKFMSFTAAKKQVLKISLENELRPKWNIF